MVVECNKMSLDPVEGTWEELQCPIIASKQLLDRPSMHRNMAITIAQPVSGMDETIASCAFVFVSDKK